MNNHPLSGITVVELTTYVAAPSTARLLANLGAEVIKIETKRGDTWRYFGAAMNTVANEDENPIFDLVNANKRSLSIDLKKDQGMKILHQLLEKADVFLTNNRPEALKKMKIDYDTIKAKYPKLVYGTVTGFGDKGPDVDKPGFDIVAFWSRLGFMVDLVKPDEYPMYSPAGFGDLTAGTMLFGGIMTALYNRQNTGKGDYVTASLYGSAIYFGGALVTSTQKKYGAQYPKGRFEGNPVVIPYRCKDNEWLMLTLIEFERYFPSLCKVLGRPELATDERFATLANAKENSSILIPMLEEAFSKKDSSEWLEQIAAEDIVCDRMRHFKEVSEDPQAWENEFLVETQNDAGEKYILANTPLQFGEMQKVPFVKSPVLGSENNQILAELGYDEEVIETLRVEKVIK